jgi:hypothetical protein
MTHILQNGYEKLKPFLIKIHVKTMYSSFFYLAFHRNIYINYLLVTVPQSRLGHYFYSNLYGRAPARGPSGVKIFLYLFEYSAIWVQS